MKLVIFNRTAPIADGGWIHIVPKGELPNREAGIVQVLDDVALDSIVANLNKDKERLGDRWPGLYAGEEHFIYNDEKSSAAFAWFKDFEKRADGIWAKDDGLTDLGREAITNKRFKFTSFVADRADTQKLKENQVRILKLDTIGFTNQANGKELLAPITNREEFRQGPVVPLAGSKQQNQRTQMKSVASKLGLSAEASEETILAEVTKVMNRATEAEGKVTPLTNRVQELETANVTLTTEQIDADFAAAGIKDEKIVNRHKPLLSDPKHFKNRQERVAFINDLAKPNPTAAAAQQRQLRNRDGKAPATGVEGADTQAAERTAATKIQNRACELQKQMPNMTLATAYRMAQNENAS